MRKLYQATQLDRELWLKSSLLSATSEAPKKAGDQGMDRRQRVGTVHC